MPFNRPIPETKRRTKLSTGVGALVEAEKLMQIAILLPSSAFIGWLVGAWADSRLHQHWIGIAGVIFGGISGLVYVVRLAVASASNSANGAGTGSSDETGSPDEKENGKKKP
jgi:F0F1-type ATP synthase assembly protein I